VNAVSTVANRGGGDGVVHGMERLHGVAVVWMSGGGPLFTGDHLGEVRV
jgi:hypothetical protein